MLVQSGASERDHIGKVRRVYILIVRGPKLPKSCATFQIFEKDFKVSAYI